tara:strand:- start:269 stop:1021 length:753 start_codon:yes stop_codon:yes gene_type:complete
MSRITDFFNTSFAAIITGASTIFNGINELINIGDISNLNIERTDAKSVFAFCYPKSSGVEGIVGKSKSGGVFKGWSLRFSSNKIQVFIAHSTGNRIFIESTNTYSTNNWYNIGFSYDGSSNANGVTIYVNGVSVTYTIVSNSLTNTTIQSGAPFQIGTNRQNTNYFEGNIAQCTFIDKEVSSSEALEIYNGGVPTDISAVSFSADVISAWSLDASDDLTISGGVTDYISGHDGTAINMTAANTDLTNFPT